VTKAKESKRASKQAEAAGDKAEAFRQFSNSMTRKAEEKSAREKFNDLHKLRPDWTSESQ
jgi:hypothetical protein